MTVVADALVGLVALLHLGFLALEMFLWTEPRGLAVFGNTPEQADQMKVLAANQWLYNGFLAAGLVWGLVVSDPVGFQFKLAFLIFVIIAGGYGAATVSRRILIVQAVPAVLALIAVVAAH
jgi:putative membrane protein